MQQSIYLWGKKKQIVIDSSSKIQFYRSSGHELSEPSSFSVNWQKTYKWWQVERDVTEVKNSSFYPLFLNTLTITPTGNLERPINLTCMSLDYGRKLEYLEETHASTVEDMQTPHRKTTAEV